MKPSLTTLLALPFLASAPTRATAAGALEEIVIGQSVALSGPDADIGRDMRGGALAVFARSNASDSLGYRVRLVTLDNANNRQRATDNTQQLLGEDGAIALFRYNSATNSLDAAALAAKSGVLFRAPFSGSSRLRGQPNVFTIRASYKDEAAKIVEAKRSVGAEKAVVLCYDDEVGRTNCETVAEAFADAGLPRPGFVVVRRGAAVGAPTVAERVDLGGYVVNYATATHQGSNWVELTMLSRGNRYVQ